ncbi:MAG TPA: hypothetical protein VHH73_09760, partial [Verrucomicrobiae bacterium]|nr:hypothetical protein [Verrucomicrobiae bacterium]
GDVMLGTPPIRLHINAASMFGTNLMWRDVSARAAIRPVAWLLHADAAKKNVELRYDEETNAVWRRTLTFDQLRNPQTLLAELGDPALLALAGPLMQLPVAPRGKEGKFSFASLWEARHDWLRIGRTQVRVYHLQARLPNRAKVEIVVSRVGEILRVELPGGVTLVNEALENW